MRKLLKLFHVYLIILSFCKLTQPIVSYRYIRKKPESLPVSFFPASNIFSSNYLPLYQIHYATAMKNKNILILIISFIILIVACSALSMSAVASNYRYTWVAMNPWNGVEGIAFTVGYFLHTDKTVSMLITIGLLLIIWWRLYALIRRTFIG